jgi:DNA-binding NarL/FixJ family response regulator
MKILIADNQALYRDGLKVNLQNLLPDAQIFEAGTLSQTFDILLKNVDINLILVDLDIPELHWETAIKALLEAAPNTRVGVIAASEDGHDVKKALALGVCCYLPKNMDTKVLNAALGLILNGGTYFPSELVNQTYTNMNLSNGKKLTNRQFEVLSYLAQGLSNKQIAYQMGVSEATVKLHINALLRAVEANNRTQAVIKAQKMGVIQ